MKKTICIIVVIILSQILISSTLIKNPVKKRWPVKTLSDKDTILVDFKNIVKSSVHEQVSFKRPEGKINTRLTSETTVYSLDCYIIGFVKELDRDIHVVIKDSKTEETMVVEIPIYIDDNIKNTSRYLQFKKLREWFVNNIGEPHTIFKKLKKPILVTLSGVGFWDTVHGQKGMAANGREIHPVLTMDLKK